MSSSGLMNKVRSRYRECIVPAAGVLVCALLIDSRADALAARDIYAERSPAVVYISSSTGTDTAETGSGSIVSPSGLVVTNAHTDKKSLRHPSRPPAALSPNASPASSPPDATQSSALALGAHA